MTTDLLTSPRCYDGDTTLTTASIFCGTIAAPVPVPNNSSRKVVERPSQYRMCGGGCNSPTMGMPINVFIIALISCFVAGEFMARSDVLNASLVTVVPRHARPTDRPLGKTNETSKPAIAWLMSFPNSKTNQGETSATKAAAPSQAPAHIVPSKRKHIKTNKTSLPAIAWLMSFPNSGTSYTINTVRKASNRATGTNYGSEGMDYLDSKRKVPPFVHGKKLGRLLPKKYLLTKTHCGNNCADCGPDQYIKTVDSFRHDCTTAFLKSSNGTRTMEKKSYSLEKVERAIHLVRNPFHNIVARFNVERHARIKQNRTDWPSNVTGFRQWCQDIEHPYQKQDEKFFGKPGEHTLEYAMEDVPCHGEFYKYVQWHNMAHEVFRMSGMATLTVHYEDFGTKFDTTIASIFRFLQLDVENDNFEAFHARSDYDNYFSKQEVKLITKLIERLSSKETRVDMKRYLL